MHEQHRSPRFLKRVCTPDELAILGHAADPKAVLWSLFAAKEAAYKLCAKRWPGLPFIPTRFEIEPSFRWIRYASRRLELRLCRALPLIHACVSSAGARPVWAVSSLRTESPSSARELLRDVAARTLGVPVSALSVGRRPLPGSWDGFAPPLLQVFDEPCHDVDVSLSHDGRYVACALVLRSTFSSAERSRIAASTRSPAAI